MAEKVTEFTIDRKTWLRGEESDNSSLLRRCDGKMCCLGSYALACGKSKKDIEDRRQPNNLVGLSREDPNFGWLLHPIHSRLSTETNCFRASEVAGKFMNINDAIDSDDIYKEKELTTLFAEQGIKVTFIN